MKIDEIKSIISFSSIFMQDLGKNLSLFKYTCNSYYWRIKEFDGVVESPIYCVAAVFQKLGILHVLPLP